MLKGKKILGELLFLIIIHLVMRSTSPYIPIDIDLLILYHHILHVIHSCGDCPVVPQVIANTEVGLRNGHSKRVDVVDMPPLGLVHSLYIGEGKVIVIPFEGNIRVGIIPTVSTPKDKDFSFVMLGIVLCIGGYRKK